MAMPAISRDLKDADPWVAARVVTTREEFAHRFAPFFLGITCVRRSQLAQDALWLQGRADARTINVARERAGLWILHDQRELTRVVTWVRQTKHNLNPSLAVDLAVMIDPDGPEGPLKPIIEWDDVPRYEAMGTIAKGFGLVWGGDWKQHDWCHVEKPRLSATQGEE